MKDTRGRIMFRASLPECRDRFPGKAAALRGFPDRMPTLQAHCLARKAVSRHARLTRTEDDMDTIR